MRNWADSVLQQKIIPITHARTHFSPGTANEFYSEADYWWPSAEAPDGPYVSRDGLSNPDCFNRHRKLMIRMSCQVAALALACRRYRDQRYLDGCAAILRTWFIDPASAMRPHLNYAQAIRGRCPGRSYGVIDSIHLAEVALSAKLLENDLPAPVTAGVRCWFEAYLAWLVDGEPGRTERCAHNNHAVCWYMQAAAFAVLTGDRALLAELRRDFREILLLQMAPDGSFPMELRRSKPYSYSLFILEALSGLAALLGRDDENFFLTAGPGGRRLADGVAFLYPYIKDKSSWPYGEDAQYDRCWPARQSALYLAAQFTGRTEYMALWQQLVTRWNCFELIRNFPIRNPRLWLAGADHRHLTEPKSTLTYEKDGEA